MRIGIDGRELVGQRTGVGRYLAALCTEWLESQDHEYVVYTPQTSDGTATLGPPFADRNASSFRHRAVAGPPGTWWEQVHLPRAANRDSLDVFFAPAYSTPMRLSAPCVVTMHDVSFEAHPEWFRWREGLRRRWLAASACDERPPSSPIRIFQETRSSGCSTLRATGCTSSVSG